MRNFNIRTRLYALFTLGIIFLVTPFYFNMQNMKETTKVIDNIKDNQIRLYTMVSTLEKDLQGNQATVLEALVLKNKAAISAIDKSFIALEVFVNAFETYVIENNVNDIEIQSRIKVIKQRIIGYKAIKTSIEDALRSNNEEDFEDALLGFNLVTGKFSEDLNGLNIRSTNLLYANIVTLKEAATSKQLTIFSAFIVALVLISLAFLKLLTLYKRVEIQLERAERAEAKQEKLQNKLLKYNDDLECEITKITKELHQKIYYHFITGLPNRNRLLEDLTSSEFSQFALFNIDKFQQFNDVYGEEEGNVALKSTAEFLKASLYQESFRLYHVGSDEFALVVPGQSVISNERFVLFVEELIHTFNKQLFKGDVKDYRLAMSAGIAFDGHKKILAYADMALKDAKSRNDIYAIFHEDKLLEKEHKTNIACHQKLLVAFETDNIISYFQPIVPINNSALEIKYESLVRLKDQDDSIKVPLSFMDVAKQNRLYPQLTQVVIQNTFKVIETYKVPCSINISMEDINNRKTIEFLYERLESFDYNGLLTIELLETESFNNYESVVVFCNKIRTYNVSIALDDFGSGYSNFTHILHLPVDFIKIDASLISNIVRDEYSRIMVETIVGLAKRLDVKTIAEFVASKEILDVVTALGVDYAQGYFLGRPKPIETYLKYDTDPKIECTSL